MPSDAWHLLIHQIPARPLYLRARLRRLLNQSGAVALKQSVYALPATKPHLERFETLAEEIRRGGGEAFVCEARFPEPGDHDGLVAAFRRARSADYERVAGEARTLLEALKGARTARATRREPGGAIERIRRELARVAAADFFAAEGRARADAALRELERATSHVGRPGRASPPVSPWVGRTWVTRRGVHVDRIACAWFIRRFLDSAARFRFVTPGAGAPRGREVGFDMPGGEFTHEGDRCSIETLMARIGPRDPGLDRIAGIVHDLDIKDGKFGFPETAGIERLLAGIVAAHADDRERLERGAVLFDDLYRSLSPRPAVSAPRGVISIRKPGTVRRGGA